MHTSFQTVTYQDDSALSDVVDAFAEVHVDMSGSRAVVAAAAEAIAVGLSRYLDSVAGTVDEVAPSVEAVHVDCPTVFLAYSQAHCRFHHQLLTGCEMRPPPAAAAREVS